MTIPHETALAAAMKAAPKFWREVRDAEKHMAKVISAYLSSIGGVVCHREPAGWKWSFDGGETWNVGPSEPGDFRFGNPDLVVPLHAPLSIASKGDDEIISLRSERDSLKALCDEMAKALEDEKERCAVFLAHREELIGLLRSFRGDVFEEVASFAENYGDTYSVGRGIAQSIRALAKAKEAE
jgi:hypothetical protein